MRSIPEPNAASSHLLADELAASAERAHKGLDAALAAIQASEGRLDALAEHATHRPK